ncbi:MAG: hypothetical protein M3406_15445 [Chloroflexota bacterium]|nr:hypothetical protein [Chloroflexota bacterium]
MDTTNTLTLKDAAAEKGLQPAGLLRKLISQKITDGIFIAPESLSMIESVTRQGRPVSEATIRAYMDATGMTDKEQATASYRKFTELQKAGKADKTSKPAARRGRPRKVAA